MSDVDLVLPEGYPRLLDELKRAVRAARLRAHRAVNTELIELYWRMGAAIAEWLCASASRWGPTIVATSREADSTKSC